MKKPILLLSGVAALSLAVYASGLFERLEPAIVVELLRDSGAWGPIAFVLLFSCLEAVGFPAFVFLLSAITLWPDWAFFLNMAGAVGAGCVGFVFARYVARDWVSAHLPERIHRYDERLAERGIRTVISVRLVFFLLAPSHWMLGLSRVSFRDMLIGSVIGLAPWVAFFTFIGVGMVDWLRQQPPSVWLAVGGGAVAALLLASLVARRIRAAA